jgi:putative membrane protein
VEPLQVLLLFTAVVAYARRSRTLARRGRPVPGARQAWFFAGVTILLAALVSPLHAIGEERLFYVHMTQHLLIGDLAPLAIVLGLDGRILRPLLALPVVGRLRVLAHPLVAFPLWVANFALWHLPAFYGAALAAGPVHALQHGLFFATGALMWAAVVEPLPGPAWFGAGPKALYVLAVRAVGTVVASVFIWSEVVFYPGYAGEPGVGPSALTDQRIGGLVMFVEGGVVTVLVFAWLFLRWTREAELRQTLIDRGHDPAVAARAARYGRSALARRGAEAAAAADRTSGRPAS